MSDKSLLQRYAGRHDESPDGVGAADSEGTENLGAFGWLRGIRDRAVSLELRRKDGTILAVNYGYMEKAEFDPSDGITLLVGGHKIRIKGRNLNAPARPATKLFEGIARHRVPWVQEMTGPSLMEQAEDAVVIEEIRW